MIQQGNDASIDSLPQGGALSFVYLLNYQVNDVIKARTMNFVRTEKGDVIIVLQGVHVIVYLSTALSREFQHTGRVHLPGT